MIQTASDVATGRRDIPWVLEKLRWMREERIWPNGSRYLWTDAYGVILLVSLYRVSVLFVSGIRRSVPELALQAFFWLLHYGRTPLPVSGDLPTGDFSYSNSRMILASPKRWCAAGTD